MRQEPAFTIQGYGMMASLLKSGFDVYILDENMVRDSEKANVLKAFSMVCHPLYQ